MSSFLGVDFFRVVNEGLVDDWAQVYAKVPFEEDELCEKGALFGVLRIKGGKELVSNGSDVFLWLDEYFNKFKERADLRGLMDGLLRMNDKLQAAWVWVVVDEKTKERRIKTTAVNGGRVVIIRDKQRLVLSDGEDKVVVGSLKTGDRLGLGVGGMVDRLETLDKEKRLSELADSLNKQVEKETDEAVAGLVLEVRPGKNLALRPVWFEKIKKKKKLEVKEEKVKSGKVLWLGVAFLVLFLLSVTGGVIKKKRQNVMASWQGELSSWQKREDEARSLAEINPAGARKLLGQVKQEVADAESVWLETKYKKDWESYKIKLEESWIEVSGEKQVEPELFLVLSLVRSRLMGSRLVNLGSDVGLLDVDEGLAVSIDLEDKKAKVVDSDSEKKWKAMGGDDKQLVFLTDEGLSLSGGEKKKFDATVAGPVEVEVFGGGAYVLDAGAGEVWKFGLAGKEIQDRRRWLNFEQEVGIGEPVDLDIDGDIWVLGKKGEVSRLRRGNRERFNLDGKPEALGGDRLAVQLKGEKVAILDGRGSRVAVFDKESGRYLYQLIWEGFSKTKDILYTTDGRLMALAEGKLYWVE